MYTGVVKQKNPAAVALGKLGGRKGGVARMGGLSAAERIALARSGGEKGGNARAASLTPEQRRETARKAAAARWGRRPTSSDLV